LYSIENYSAVLELWPLEDLAELQDGSTGCGELARGGCLCAWNFSVTRSFVLFVGGGWTRQTWRCRCVSDSLLVYRLKIPRVKNNALNYTWPDNGDSSRLSCYWLKNGSLLRHRESKSLYSVRISDCSCCS